MDIMKTFEIFLSLPKSIITGEFINILHLDYKDNFFKAKSSVAVDKIGDTTQIRGNNKIRKSHFFIQIGLLRVIESFMRGKV